MQLDFIDNINEYGDNMVRLYDFDRSEAILFRDVLLHLIEKKGQFPLVNCEFIEPRNCYLTLRVANIDEGIVSDDNVNFFCYMTLDGYRNMVKILEPFCVKETKGYQYLYDIDSLTDFVLSPAGSAEIS